MKASEFLKGTKLEIGINLEKNYNYLLPVEYDGTSFVWLAIPKKWNSIQEKIENSVVQNF